jgi:hyperosmotically inducible periplasmic protein
MNSSVKLQPLPARRLTWALVLFIGLAACGDKPPVVPAGTATSSVPEVAAREPNPVSDPVQPKAGAAKADTGQRAADADLAARVKSALVADPEINALEIDVVAAQGTVTLYGTAPNRAKREKATRVAARIEGVKSVTNKLAVVAGS